MRKEGKGRKGRDSLRRIMFAIFFHIVADTKSELIKNSRRNFKVLSHCLSTIPLFGLDYLMVLHFYSRVTESNLYKILRIAP